MQETGQNQGGITGERPRKPPVVDSARRAYNKCRRDLLFTALESRFWMTGRGSEGEQAVKAMLHDRAIELGYEEWAGLIVEEATSLPF
jgi:hypothetical protein